MPLSEFQNLREKLVGTQPVVQVGTDVEEDDLVGLKPCLESQQLGPTLGRRADHSRHQEWIGVQLPQASGFRCRGGADTSNGDAPAWCGQGPARLKVGTVL